MSLPHFPCSLTASCSCDCIEKKRVAWDLGWLSRVLMRSSGGSKVAAAAGTQGLFVSCSFRPELCSNQCSLQSNRKNILWATELPWSHWISPRAELRTGGNACSAHCCRQSPSQLILSVVHQVTVQYNPLSKCTNSSLLLRADLVAFCVSNLTHGACLHTVW